MRKKSKEGEKLLKSVARFPDLETHADLEVKHGESSSKRSVPDEKNVAGGKEAAELYRSVSACVGPGLTCQKPHRHAASCP